MQHILLRQEKDLRYNRSETLPRDRMCMLAGQDDDARLLERIREGDHPAFAELVRRHSGRFYAIAYRFLSQRADAEDIVQEAFLKLWERPEMWQPDKQAKFTTWFTRIVMNLCLDKRKRKAPLPLAEDFDVAAMEMPQDDALVERQMQLQLEQEIRSLPDRQQAALNLCFYEGMSNQEAADAMGVHLKALQSLLMRAKATLSKKMKRFERAEYYHEAG